MDALCCFQVFLNGGDSDSDEFKPAHKQVSEKIDVLTNEGAEYQNDLWELELHTTRKRFEKAKQELLEPKMTAQSLLNVESQDALSISAQDFLQQLTSAYSRSGFSQKMRYVHQIFTSVEPLTSAISVMSNSSMFACLIWGGLMLFFQTAIKFTRLWDDMVSILEEAAKRLPRFHTYTRILHTPRLHAALREVYRQFIGICFILIDWLKSRKCEMFLKAQWNNAQFKTRVDALQLANREFENEAHLADVEDRQNQHEEVISTIQSALPSSELMTNVTMPRNPKFTGRNSTLALLHSKLEGSFNGEFESRSACSCLIHGIGGMGKTETALEYTYRFRGCYSYVFWIPSETETYLMRGFFKVFETLRLGDVSKTQPSKKIQLVMDWLKYTDKTWLIVFDNAIDPITLAKFWSSSCRGAVIVTSQSPLLECLTTSSIHIPPMPPAEGGALVQAYLNRGSSEKKEACKLSETLGGLPLAIVHFTGCIIRSQCPISQIHDSFNNRQRSSQIWKKEHVVSASRGYEHTLNTVWGIGIERLPTDSAHLLEWLAFLDPDQIPVDIFVGNSRVGVVTHWEYWDIDRFNAAVSALLERNLIERYRHENLDVLRTHRALQRSILHRLDENIPLRERRFGEVVSMIREAVPIANIIKRSDATQFPIFAKYLPQVISLHEIYIQSVPKLENRLDFAAILHDLGFYSLALQNTPVMGAFLSTAEKICTALLPSDPEKIIDLLANILSILQTYFQNRGVEGQVTALEMTTRLLDLRAQQTKNLPRDQWTLLQIVNVARAHVDHGCALVQLNRIEQAIPSFDAALSFYHSIDNPVRLAHATSCQIPTKSALQKKDETRTLISRSILGAQGAIGAENPLTLQIKFVGACAYFTIGDLQESFDLHAEVLRDRNTVFGPAHELTLSSQYCLAVCNQWKDDLDSAETALREVLIHQEGSGWTKDDIARTKFRLFIILRKQQRTKEASKIYEQLGETLSSLGIVAHDSGYTDADDMALLETGVSRLHGRTAGIWSNGTLW